MSKILRINTKLGPKALGPYSTASFYQGVLYVSGQIGIEPETGNIVGPDVESQTKRAMDNLKMFLDELKVDMNNIIKCTVYLKVLFYGIQSMADFSKVNEIYGKYFIEGSYPSRVAIEVAGLPKNALVEIEVAVAY